MEVVRESIFVSALRSFARAFFALIGVGLALLLLSFFSSIFAPPIDIEPKTTLKILPGPGWKRELLSPTAPVLLQIDIHGVIGDPMGVHAETIRDMLIDSREGFLDHNRVRGILLHINTPGGTVVDSDDIYRMLQQYKAQFQLPVYAYVDGLCASGGMYVASAADQIFASPSSVIGSVGVIMGPFFNVSDTLSKLGIQAKTLTRGLDKDTLNPTRPWKEGEDASLQAITAFLYDRFVNVVSSSRPKIDKQRLISQYGANVFDCQKAADLGYIDQPMTSYDEALAALAAAAKIDPKQPYQIVSLEPRKPLFSSLLAEGSSLFSGKITHTVDLGPLSRLHGKFAYYYDP
jgi:signal peptide peptidase SppA